MSELKPCPFCGTSVVGIEHDGLYRWVECGNMDCNAAGKVFAFLTDVGNADHIVANNWNTRPIEDALRVELEKRTDELHYANTACMEMKHELARLQAERRWRKYPDEEPENLDEEVQLWSKVYGLTKASFNSWNDYVGYSDITHWMPLPASPESKE